MSKIVFLNKNSKFLISNKVNVILSNELYWTRIFDIPIDSHKEVLEVLPSFFEDYFDTKDYKYYAIKIKKHKYLCFAYNENDIVNAIKNSNLEFKNIINIYFAQNELLGLFEDNNYYKIEKKIYSKKGDLLISLPNNLSKNIDAKTFDINKIQLSKHKLFINQSSKYIDIKTANILSAMIIIFSLIIFFKVLILKDDINTINVKEEMLKSKYNLPNSKIQTKSILSEYNDVKNKYENFRVSMQYLLNYKSVTSTKLISFEFKRNTIILSFDNKDISKINNYISKKYKILSSNSRNNIYKVKVEI